MEPLLIHGGDVYTPRRLPKGVELLDFSANLNPLGMPESVKAALIACADHCDQYPDPLCRKLRAGLEAREKVPASRIVCGNGAADLIYRLVWAVRPQRALVAEPTFAEYEMALGNAGCQVERFFLREENGFVPDEAFLQAVESGIQVVFFCNPNNPTGVMMGKDYLLKLAARCQQAGALLVVDECFLDFVDGGEKASLIPYLEQFPNTVVLKAFTKLYAMAGLRLGYLLCGNEALAEQISRTGQAWSVSVPAAACGLAALGERDYPSKTRDAIREERAFLWQTLTQFGCRVYGSQANYLFFYSSRQQLPELLLKEGILIRNCSNYPGLGAGWCRIAVRTSEENRKFAAALGKIIGEESSWQNLS